MINQYADWCFDCGVRIAAGAGQRRKTAVGWRNFCARCFEARFYGPREPAPKPVQADGT